VAGRPAGGQLSSGAVSTQGCGRAGLAARAPTKKQNKKNKKTTNKKQKNRGLQKPQNGGKPAKNLRIFTKN
jgi:hypothetical protein